MFVLYTWYMYIAHVYCVCWFMRNMILMKSYWVKMLELNCHIHVNCIYLCISLSINIIMYILELGWWFEKNNQTIISKNEWSFDTQCCFSLHWLLKHLKKKWNRIRQHDHAFAGIIIWSTMHSRIYRHNNFYLNIATQM